MAAGKAKGVGGVAQLVRLLDQGGMGGRGRRSSLSRWMRTHHDAFAAMLVDKEPAWDEVATALTAMGLRDGEDKPPTGERTRKAWWGVRRAKLGAVAKRQDGPGLPALKPGEIAPAVYVTSGTQLDGATTSRPRMALDLQPATPLDERRLTSIQPLLAPFSPSSSGLGATDSMTGPGQPTQEGASANERMGELFQQMNANKVPLPKVVS